MIDRLGANATVCRGMIDDTTKPEAEAPENKKKSTLAPRTISTIPSNPQATLRRNAKEMICSIDRIASDIVSLLWPRSRSVNVIGTSTICSPC